METSKLVILGEKIPCSQEADERDGTKAHTIKDSIVESPPSKRFSSNITHQTEENSLSTDLTEDRSERFNHRYLQDETPGKPLEVLSVDDDLCFVSKASTLSGSFSMKRESAGVPSEIIVIDDFASANDEELDIHTRFQVAECMVSSYKEALNSTEQVVESLRHSLRETRANTECLLEERNSLLATIREMEETENTESSEFSLIKLLMVAGLCFHLWGGSESLLIVAAVVYLFDDFLHRVI